jgi:hypothetical protein
MLILTDYLSGYQKLTFIIETATVFLDNSECYFKSEPDMHKESTQLQKTLIN